MKLPIFSFLTYKKDSAVSCNLKETKWISQEVCPPKTLNPQSFYYCTQSGSNWLVYSQMTEGCQPLRSAHFVGPGVTTKIQGL